MILKVIKMTAFLNVPQARSTHFLPCPKCSLTSGLPVLRLIPLPLSGLSVHLLAPKYLLARKTLLLRKGSGEGASSFLCHDFIV